MILQHSRVRRRTGVCAGLLAAGLGGAGQLRAIPAGQPRGAAPFTGTADPSCAVDFDSLIAIARRDYAGYQTAAQLRPAALAAIADTLRRAAAGAPPGAPACEVVLARWLAFFRDGHLHLVPAVPPERGPAGPGPVAPVGPDPARPSLVALDSATLLLRIPSFDLTYKPAIDSLLSAGAVRLARAPVLITDVRSNGGGGDAAFAGLVPLIYTGPIRIVGADAWASPANAAYFREILAIPELPESDRELVRRLLAGMERRPHRFVPIDRDTVLRFGAGRAAPGTVAVLYDRGSGSTTEEFLLQAQQSRKTMLFSRERSAGALDYANVRQAPLPSGRWGLQFGTSRSRRLPAHPVDPDGIAPAVRIPPGVRDEVAYVRGYLAGRAGRAGRAGP